MSTETLSAVHVIYDVVEEVSSCFTWFLSRNYCLYIEKYPDEPLNNGEGGPESLDCKETTWR